MSIFWASIKINSKSQLSPVGAQGRHVIMTSGAITDAISQIRDSPIVMMHSGPTIGKINKAKVVGNWLVISGRCDDLKIPSIYGLSYSVSCEVEDIYATVWKISRINKFRHMAITTDPSHECSKIKTYKERGNVTGTTP